MSARTLLSTDVYFLSLPLSFPQQVQGGSSMIRSAGEIERGTEREREGQTDRQTETETERDRGR